MLIGDNQMLMIVLVILLLFGPDKLPQAGRTIGRAIRQFRETQARMTAMVQSEIVDPLTTVAQDPSMLVGADKKEAAALEEDADSEDIASRKAAEARSETFAERRARLAREQAGDAAASDSESERPAKPDAEPAPAVEAGSEECGTEPGRDEDLETEMLYVRRPRPRQEGAAQREEASAPISSAEPFATPEDDAAKGGDR